MNKERYAVDRIEEGLAVLIPDRDGIKPLYLSADEYGLQVNDIIDISAEGENIISFEKRDDIKNERLNLMKSRLKNLFRHSKKQ